MDSFRLFIEAFRHLHWSVQLVLGSCLLIAVGGLLTLFLLVAINPLALGGIVGLMTTVTSTATFLLRRGSPPTPGH